MKCHPKAVAAHVTDIDHIWYHAIYSNGLILAGRWLELACCQAFINSS
jgi:hypothetical protein